MRLAEECAEGAGWRVEPTSAEQISLQRAASLGWRAEEVEERGGWLLRANTGWTRRANSALPVGAESGTDGGTEESLERFRAFYARRGLPAIAQMPLPACAALDEKLADVGFEAMRPTFVLTACIKDVLGGRSGEVPRMEVEVRTTPNKDWLEAYEAWGGLLGEVGEAVILRHPRVGFASIRDAENEVVAVGRVAVDNGWAGLSTAAVHPKHRRRGLATALIHARLRWAAENHDARRAYSQVERHNEASLAMCRKVGFTLHHEYHYRIERRLS